MCKVSLLLVIIISSLSYVVINGIESSSSSKDNNVFPQTVGLDTGGLSRESFPKGFVFGTATAAYQVEGMASKGGRGPSIWDTFVKTPGTVLDNSTGEIADDQYHRYKEDINLMKTLNFEAYKFSISWSRILTTNNIKSTLNRTESAKEFMKSVEDSSQSESADKSLAGTLMGTLTTMKFNGSRSMHGHIVEMTNIATRLKTMGMEVNENFLVTFILNSLPSEYGPFHMNYNTLRDKWNVHELQSMLIQEEARLKKSGNHSANLIGHKGAGKKPWKKDGKGKKGLSKVNESSVQIHHKGPSNDTCRFCKKTGHYQKDCLKRKAWFEKKGISYDPNHKRK